MRPLALFICSWPGLPQLWLRGSWSAMGWAVGFSCWVNLLLWTTWVEPGLLGEAAVWIGWPLCLLIWVWGFWQNWRFLSGNQASGKSDRRLDDESFAQAQHPNFAGNWTEAESIVERMIAANPRDVEARLLSATIFRRTERPREALRQLARLEQQDAARRWLWEIAQERESVQLQLEPEDELSESVTDHQTSPDVVTPGESSQKAA